MPTYLNSDYLNSDEPQPIVRHENPENPQYMTHAIFWITAALLVTTLLIKVR